MNHDWQTQTYVVTLLDGTEVWAATLVCECANSDTPEQRLRKACQIENLTSVGSARD